MAGLHKISDHSPKTGWRYLIALGSNRRHHRHGPPAKVLRAALAALEAAGAGRVESVAPIIASAPLGPSLRTYANGAAVVFSDLMPDDMLQALKSTELAFGRKQGGRRWAARVLDLDIVLWNGGKWRSDGLFVPHIAFRTRAFVLGPARAIAPNWRDPVTALRISQLHARLTRPRHLPRGSAWSGL